MRAALVLVVVLGVGCVGGGDALVVGTTTTVQDSGLLDVLLAAFTDASGIAAKAVVGGTGEMHEKGKRGDVDVLLTHSPEREARLLEEGWTLRRTPVFRDRFVVAGPPEDPVGVRGAQDATDAFRRIHAGAHLFASRGDASGTHERELSLWREAGLDPSAFDASWYKETGAGQAQTLLFADERGAYLLVDEAALLQMRAAGKASGVVGLLRDGPGLENEYAVSELDPARVPGIRADLARGFAEWLAGPGQHVVAAHRIGGATPFEPGARP